MVSLTTPSLIAANAAALLLCVLFAYAGWHSIRVEKRRRRKQREQIRQDRATDDDLRMRVLRSKVRCDLLPMALAAQCDVILRTRPVPLRLVTDLTEDDFALLAGDVR